MITIDIDKRRVIIERPTTLEAKDISEPVVINEFDKIQKVFLEETKDRYDCELVLVNVEIMDEDMQPTGEYVTKAFGRRIGYEGWLVEFDLESFTV